MSPLERPLSLENLLVICTVRLSISGGHGSGFFVAPGLILTCRHVVKDMGDRPIPVIWTSQHQNHRAVVKQLPTEPDVDLALLAVQEPIPDHPCVYLGGAVQSGDRLYAYGYPKDSPEGSPATFETEGITGGTPFIKFKAGQVHPGLSGAPLLNWRTGMVCGVVKFTHDRNSALGGGAVPIASALEHFPELVALQQQVHQYDPQWIQRIQQRVVEGTIVMQTLGGMIVHRLGEEQQLHLKPRYPQFRLRASFPGLLDRREECQQAMSALQQRQSVEVNSLQGCGKTTILEYLADLAQLSALFPDGIVFQRLGQQAFVYDVVQAIYDRLYESTLPIKATTAQIEDHLQHRQALVVLDDVQLAVNDLQELLGAIPRCTVIVATPARQLIGQKIASVTLEGLPLTDALALLERGLGRTLTPAERPQAESLCRALHGHPGQILLWAGRVTAARSLATVLHQVQSETMTGQVLTFLQTNQRWLVVLLAAIGGVALLADQAAAMTGIPDAEAVLGSLVQANVVQMEGDRYRLDSTLVETLQQHNLHPWRQKILHYFKTWAMQHRQDVEALLDNQEALVYTLEWAITQADWQSVLLLVRSLEGALALSGQWGAWVQVLQWGLQAARTIDDRTAEAWVLHQLGTHALCLRATSVARQNLETAKRLRESLGDVVGAAVSHHNLGLLPVPPVTDDQPPLLPPPPAQIPDRQAAPRRGRLLSIVTTAIALIGLGGLWSTVWRPQPVTPAREGLASLEVDVEWRSPGEPPLLSNLTAKAMSPTEITLTWAGGNRPRGLRVDRSLKAGNVFQPIATLPAGSKRYSDKPLQPNTTYYYRVCVNLILGTCSQTISAKTPLPAASLTQFTINGEQVQGGQSLQGTVVLSNPAPQDGMTIQLSSDAPGVAIVPAAVRVPAGETRAIVTINTTPVSQPTPVTLTASYQGTKQSDTVTVNPAPSPEPLPPAQLRELTLDASEVVGGGTVRGKVWLNSSAPEGGITIQLTSSNPDVASIPATLTIPAGTSSVPFTVVTGAVEQSTTVQIAAAKDRRSAQASLRVTAPPPPADLRADAIEFELVEQTSPYEGLVRIVGYVRNVGQSTFKPQAGATIVLQEIYPGGKAKTVAEIALPNLAAKETTTIDYTRAWSKADEFPPSYRLAVIAEDPNPSNDETKRDGQAINDLFIWDDRQLPPNRRQRQPQ